MLGLCGATALVTGGMVGAGILVLPSIMSVFGTWSVAGWLLAAFIAYSIATIFGRLSTMFKGGAGPVHYIADTFGPNYGYLVAFGYFLAMCFSGSAIAMTLGDYALPLLGCADCIPSWLVGYIVALALLGLNMLSSGSANALLVLFTGIKVLFFFAIAAFGCTNFASYQPHFGPITDIFKSSSMAMFAFLGIEFAAAASSSIKDPEKNVKRATTLGLLFSTIAFIGVHCAVMFTLPDAQNSATPVYDTAVILFGNLRWLATAFGLVAIISCLSTLNGIIVVQGSNLKNVADRSWLHKSLGTKTKQGFAWKGGLIFAVLSLLILQTFSKPTMLTLAVSFIAILYLLSCAVDMKKKGVDIYNIMGVVSSLLMLYNVDLYILSLMIGIYALGFIAKFISKKVIR